MLLAGTALLSSCSKEIDDDPQLTDGNRVVFTLGGAVTRAAGDNDSATPTAATAEEKKIESLLAVVFGEDGSYYKTFETNYSDADQTASFDLGKNGTYDIHFVANADETLKNAVMTLTDQDANSQVTEDDLLALIASQEVGKQDDADAWHPFLMLSTEAAHVVSKAGVVTDGGQVIMRRLAVRIDLVNAAEGVTINSVKFINRTKQSRLGASNDMNFSTEDDLYEEKTYDNIDLVGNFDIPTEYKATIYSYENVDVTPGGAHLPALEIKYTMDGMKFTHTVTFMDSKDDTGKTPLALKRNYLYRIVLTKPLDLDFDIIVDDWNTAEAFQVDDLPFETHDQQELNDALKVNMFTDYNVLSLDKNTKKVTFYSQMSTSREECPTTSYFTYNWLAGTEDGTYSSNGANQDVDLRNEILRDDEGNEYRIPTMGETALLIPVTLLLKDRPYVDENGQWLKAADGSGNGITHPRWDNGVAHQDLRMIEKDQDGNDYAFTETLYFGNDEDYAPNTGGESLSGQSYIRLGKFSHTYACATTATTYNLYTVYALRFKGTSEYAAYKYECCEAGDIHYLSIKIKALPQESTFTIDDITDNNSFWSSGYLEFKFPAAGFYPANTKPNSEPDEDNAQWRTLNSYLWTSTFFDSSQVYNWGFGSGDVTLDWVPVNNNSSRQLRLVKVSE